MAEQSNENQEPLFVTQGKRSDETYFFDIGSAGRVFPCVTGPGTEMDLFLLNPGQGIVVRETSKDTLETVFHFVYNDNGKPASYRVEPQVMMSGQPAGEHRDR